MAIITLKPGADPLEVSKMLREQGITMGQRLSDGRYAVFINPRKWLCMQYPELKSLYEEDRAFSQFCGYDLHFPIPLPLSRQI